MVDGVRAIEWDSPLQDTTEDNNSELEELPIIVPWMIRVEVATESGNQVVAVGKKIRERIVGDRFPHFEV